VTLFEYLAIAYSLVLSFAAIRLVAGLPHAIDPSRRYWVHVAYVCAGVFAALALFWAHWSTREVAWTFPGFVVNLAGPGIVYFLSCTMIPDDPSAVRSWRDYFFSVRRRYFGGLCVWAVIMVVNTTFFLDAPLVFCSSGAPSSPLWSWPSSSGPGRSLPNKALQLTGSRPSDRPLVVFGIETRAPSHRPGEPAAERPVR
jgi:hypothetical protein